MPLVCNELLARVSDYPRVLEVGATRVAGMLRRYLDAMVDAHRFGGMLVVHQAVPRTLQSFAFSGVYSHSAFDALRLSFT